MDDEDNNSKMDKWWQVVPDQHTGGETDAIAKLECKDSQQAKFRYSYIRNRLADVNSWGKVSHTSISSFKLFDVSGEPVARLVKEGDYIRIDVPGPGPSVGNGYDWVHVEIVRDEMINGGDLFSIQVRPSPHPFSVDGEVAHFLKPEATSTFQVRRIGTAIYAEEHARNESPNLNTGHLLDNIRNGIIGTAAALGLSYPQWKSLVEGLIAEK